MAHVLVAQNLGAGLDDEGGGPMAGDDEGDECSARACKTCAKSR
jgi:hypothetical protein